MKKVIVIGAGVAGLSTAIFLQKAGFDVHLYEKNDHVGGLCSGYYVKGHYIDHCLHWLMGTHPTSEYYQLWSEVGVFSDEVKMISLPTLGEFIYKGEKISFDRDIKKCEKDWLKYAPEDKKAIKKFFNAVEDVSSLMNYVLTPKENKKKMELIKTLPSSLHIYASMKETREEYSKRFKNKTLQFAIRNAQTGYNNMFFFMDLYGIFTKGNADVPSGGALYMTKRMEEKFLSLGGHLYLNTKVDEIVTHKDIAKGIKINGKITHADEVVSCLDPHYTLNILLNNKYQNEKLDRIERNIKNYPISSAYCLYVTIEGDISNIAVPTCLYVEDFQVGAHNADSILIRPYGFDKEYFVKDNKTVVSIFIDQNQDDYLYFKSLDRSKYTAERHRIDKRIIEEIEKQFPYTKGKIEILDHFSPLELKKHTNTSYGALQGYSFAPKGSYYTLKTTLKELSNFHMCSQWNRAIGGTPTALEYGYKVAKEITNKYQPKKK